MSNKSRIGDHAKVRRGASPRPISDPKYFGGTVGWVRISDVTSAKKYLRKTEQYVSPIGESLSVRVDCGDLIMSICATVGRPVIVDMPACIHDGFVQFYNVSHDDKEYMYYLLQFHEKDLERKGQPGTQVNLNTTIVENFEAFFPTSLDEQRKIARILSSVDSVIEKTEAAIAKYEAIKAGMMQDLFTRGIDLDTGKLRPNYEESPELYKESKLGWIPKEWDVEILSKYTVTYAGGTPSRSRSDYFGGSIAWVSSSEVNNPKIYKTKETITQEGLDNSSAKWVKSGSVLIAMYGATAGKISRLFIDATTNQAVLACMDNKDLRARYLYYIMFFLKDQILFKVQGSGQPNLSKDIIDKTLLLIPSPDEQVFISQRLEKIDSVIEFEEHTYHKYQQLKQALMSDLLTGKVRVKYEENNVEYKEDKVEYEEDKVEAV
ncbi:restriction endonuclease subunit S [Methanosarcina mazei]|uniref:Type I restriction modification DNA specificity domain-containing protein n=1 Tax=Methanosarcina mazei TaxID=2209 RepID=A0A0F8RHJ6_METMZ|nr:restriction endonuclease subunit S [Methanosarcina mazei]KKG06140.1 hypothetical protein DU47_12845 [Methanosarcina mazei]KKH86882.1 hypothetical protein DU80_07060 [Methanosarcina mazei]